MKPNPTLNHSSAFLPVAVSVGPLAIVLIFIALNGTAPQADEGAAAHVWQVLMAAQAPLVLFFAIKCVQQAPRQALPILAMQVGADEAGKLLRATANDANKVAGKIAGLEGRAAPTHASFHPEQGAYSAIRADRARPLLRCARQHRAYRHLPQSDHMALAARVGAPQPVSRFVAPFEAVR